MPAYRRRDSALHTLSRKLRSPRRPTSTSWAARTTATPTLADAPRRGSADVGARHRAKRSRDTSVRLLIAYLEGRCALRRRRRHRERAVRGGEREALEAAMKPIDANAELAAHPRCLCGRDPARDVHAAAPRRAADGRAADGECLGDGSRGYRCQRRQCRARRSTSASLRARPSSGRARCRSATCCGRRVCGTAEAEWAQRKERRERMEVQASTEFARIESKLRDTLTEVERRERTLRDF